MNIFILTDVAKFPFIEIADIYSPIRNYWTMVSLYAHKPNIYTTSGPLLVSYITGVSIPF